MADKSWTYEEVLELYRQFNPNAASGEGATIVVAEDNEPMRNLVCAALEKQGYTALPTDNGLDALRMIRDAKPGCVVLDINLPKVSGLDVLEAVKRDPKYAAIPIMIISARKEKRDILLATKLGASAYLVKPFQTEELLSRIQAVLPS